MKNKPFLHPFNIRLTYNKQCNFHIINGFPFLNTNINKVLQQTTQRLAREL